MVRPLPSFRTRIYELGDGRYLYTRFNFDTVLIDYGLNRIETKDTMLVGRVRYERHNYPDILDFHAFNPYIDLFELISLHRYHITKYSYLSQLGKCTRQ